MKVSSKGRYALAAMIVLAQSQSQDTPLTVIGISRKIDISKIYLEQVFSLLHKGSLVTSIKGSHGGYQLSRPANEIFASEILSVTETSIFEDTEETGPSAYPGIERALQNLLFQPANKVFKEVFERMTLSDLAEEALRKSDDEGYMYCI
jgi:Rrf2 family protein